MSFGIGNKMEDASPPSNKYYGGIKMNKYRVWFSIYTRYYGYDEDFLDVEAANADQAYENVRNANSDVHGFNIESVEPLD